MGKRFLACVLMLSVLINLGAMPVVLATENTNDAVLNEDAAAAETDTTLEEYSATGAYATREITLDSVNTELTEYVGQLNLFNLKQSNPELGVEAPSAEELNEKLLKLKADIEYIYEITGTDSTELAEFIEDVNKTLVGASITFETFYTTNTSNMAQSEQQAFNNIVSTLKAFVQNWTNETGIVGELLGLDTSYSSGHHSSSSGASGSIDYREHARCGNSITEDGYVETNDGVNRRPSSVKNIDYYTDIAEQFCSTRGLNEFTLTSETGKSFSVEISETITCRCSQRNSATVNYKISKPLLAYTSLDEEITLKSSSSVRCSNPDCKEKISISDETIKLSDLPAFNEHYEEVELNGTTYYVKTDMLDDLEVDSNYRVLFKPSGNTLTLTVFNPTRIDFYYEVERGAVDGYEDTAKFGIYPFYEDVSIANTDGGTQHQINQGASISEKIFFVCGFCAKCTTCDNTVASTGNTIKDRPDDFCLSRYCAEEHACGFFWDIDNSGDGIDSLEGVDCWASERLDGSVFCEDHKCKTCSRAVIGVNLLDSRADVPSVYQGENESFYSKFCTKHFCRANMCIKERINSDLSQPDKSSDGICHDFPIYCSDHANVCGVCGKNTVTVSTYEKNGGKAVCASCANSNYNTELVECPLCGTTLLKKNTIKYSGTTVCNICATKPMSGELIINNESVSMQDLMEASGETNWFDFCNGLMPNGSVTLGEATDYKQFGMSWSSIPYSVGNIGKSGCGPTSVAICASVFGIKLNPGELVQSWTGEKLYASYTSNGKLLNSIGLTQTKVSKSQAIAHLQEGKPLILRCTKGYYTSQGHYMAATAIRTVNGKTQVYISNPSSYYKTGWTDFDKLEPRGVFEMFAVDVK